MALPAGAIWEVRSTATANNVNGGGFNSARGGTDYSQQDAAQLAITDLTSVLASTTITSATGGFTSVMVGNYIHITSGTNFVAGWYEITTFTDGNNVIIDRACTTGSNGSAGVAKVGGAMSLASTLDDDMFEAAVAGNIFYVKAGTYTLGEAVNIAVTGTATSPIKIIGYNTTRGDNPTGDNRPRFACGASNFSPAAGWHIYNMRFSGTGTVVQSQSNGENLAVNCKALNTSTTADRSALQLGGDGFGFNCEGISYMGRGGIFSGRYFIYGCWFHDSSIGILDSGAAQGTIDTCISSSNVVAAIRFSAADTTLNSLKNCTLYGSENTTGIGIDITATGANNFRIFNNIIYGFATGVSHIDANTEGFDDYNDYFNNDNDVNNVANWQKGSNDVAIAPAFSSVGQVTGTTGAFVAGNGKLVDTSKDFTTLGVVAGRDFVYIVSGTGVTAGIYGISSISTTTNPNDTLNLDINPGTDTTADKVYQITIGQNFAITGAI